MAARAEGPPIKQVDPLALRQASQVYRLLLSQADELDLEAKPLNFPLLDDAQKLATAMLINHCLLTALGFLLGTIHPASYWASRKKTINMIKVAKQINLISPDMAQELKSPIPRQPTHHLIM